jgi:hypothetical protein
MENFLGRLLAKIAPRAARALTALIHVSEEDESVLPRVIAYENQVRELRQEIDELRQDSLRIAELYDLVFKRLNETR